MHCCWEGVTIQMANIWFNSKNHNQDWYIGKPNTINEINAKLKQIQIPHTFREMESIDTRSNWKGNKVVFVVLITIAIDWKYWCLYISNHVLKGMVENSFLNTILDILPNKYYNHWILFSNVMTLLSQYQLERKYLQTAKTALELFVQEVDSLYGSTEIKINIHQLLHLEADIQSWGLLWTHNSFAFESMNGVLTRFMHGTKANPKSAIHALSCLQQMSDKEFNIQSHCGDVKLLISKLQSRKTK